MKRILQFAIFALLGGSALRAQTAAMQGFCALGGVKVVTQGLTSTTTVQASYPQCLVTVFLTGTTTKATIYSDVSNTPLSNPFTAKTNGSWLFYSTQGSGVDIVMSGGTPIPFPQPFTLTDVLIGNGGGGITTSLNGLTGSVILAAGTNVTLDQSGQTITVNATGGGGGGGNLPAPLGQFAGYPTAGTTTTVGPGNAGAGSTKINFETFISNGVFTSDQWASNPSAPTDGISNAQAACAYTDCFIFVPANSTEAEQGQMPVTTATNVSAFLQDYRGSSIGEFTTNPQPTSFTNYQFQTPHATGCGYTLPNPGLLQGGEQTCHYEFNIFAAPSHNLGQVEDTGGFVPITSVSRTGNIATITTSVNLRPTVPGGHIVVTGVADSSFNTGDSTILSFSGNSITYSNSGANTTSSGGQATTHTGAFPWSLTQYSDVTNYFASQGIKGSTNITMMSGIGDQIKMYDYVYCGGGWLVFSDEGCYSHGEHLRSTFAYMGNVTSITDPYHFVTSQTQGGSPPGDGQMGMDRSRITTNVQLISRMFSYGATGSPSGYIPTIVFDFPTYSIVSAVSSGGTATITYTGTPGFTPIPLSAGGKVKVAGVSNAVFNGTFTIIGVTVGTITYALAGSASSSGGTIQEALVPSYARGHLVTDAIVTVQEGTLASSTFTVHSDNGTPFTVSGNTAPDGVGLFCMGAVQGNQMGFGVQVTAITAPDDSGNQSVTALINRNVPAVGSTTVAAQGGACGNILSYTADETNLQGFTIGTPAPVLMSQDDHSVGVAVYAAGQEWRTGAGAGSQVLTEGNANGIPGQGIFGGSFTAQNVKRVGGVLTLTIPFQTTTNPGDMIIGQNHIVIVGCPDVTVNGEQSNAFTSPSNGVFSLVQSGSDTTCPDGTTSVLMPFNYRQATMAPGVEIYDVADHTPGLSPISVINGHFGTSYQPAIQVGDLFYTGPNASMIVTENRMSMEMVTPAAQIPEGLEINLVRYSDSGAGIVINSSPIDSAHLIGSGGVQGPPSGVTLNGPFGSGFAMGTQPLHNGCVICVGGGGNYPDGLRNWYMYSVNGNNGLKWDQPSQTWSTVFGGQTVETINAQQVSDTVPLDIPTLLFTTSSFLGGYSNVITNTLGDIGNNAGAQPAGLIAWDNYIGFKVAPTVTTSGTPGTTQYLYQISMLYDGGYTWTNVAVLRTGNATLNSTNFNVISCSVIPAGKSGEVWVIDGDHTYDIGTCPNNASSVNDQGTRGSPVIGLSPYGMGGTLYIGEPVASGAGRGFSFTQNSPFATSGIPSITAGFSQPSDGNISADTTARGNGLATLTAALFTGPAKLPSTTVAGLPSAASNTGVVRLVTDASTFTVGTCTGGGTDTMIAVSDGTNWTCH